MIHNLKAMVMFDDFAAKNLLDNIMTLWVKPELEKRRLPEDFRLRAAQIIFHEGKPHEVRINEEVKAIGKVKLKSGVFKAKRRKNL